MDRLNLWIAEQAQADKDNGISGEATE